MGGEFLSRWLHFVPQMSEERTAKTDRRAFGGFGSAEREALAAFEGWCPMCWGWPSAEGGLCARCESCIRPFCGCAAPVLRMAHERVFCRGCGEWEP